MVSSKLINLLRTFTKDEMEEFGDFVHSPFHNKLRMVTKLFEAIKDFYPEFKSSELAKENIYKKLYKSNYSDELIRKLISQLLKLAEDYLAYKNIKADTFLIKTRLLPELNMRRQEILFKKNYSLLETQLEKMAVKGKDYYYNKYQMEVFFIRYSGILTKASNTGYANLQKHADDLITGFLIAITEIYAYMKNDLKAFPERKYEFRFIEEIKNHLIKNKEFYNDSIFVNLYFNSLMMLTSDEEIYYYSLKNLIRNNYKEFPDIQRHDIYTLLTNYCQVSIFEGKDKFLGEMLELLKESYCNNGQIDTDGSFRYISFYSIVYYSLVFKEFQWAENFINDNIDKVNPKYRQSTFYYCSALLDYYKGNYEKALVLLSKAKTENLSFKHQIRTLTLMIYYSLNETEQFISLVDSFKHFINDNKLLPGIHRTLYANFLNFSFRLFKGREDINNFNLKAFKKELLETNYITNKPWLIEKTEELEKQIDNTKI